MATLEFVVVLTGVVLAFVGICWLIWGRTPEEKTKGGQRG